MTAVVASSIEGVPILVGDVALTDKRSGQRVGYAGKVYVLAPNVALGWSGNASLAKPALMRLRRDLSSGAEASAQDIEKALRNLEDLRERGTERLELVGWLVVAPSPKVIRWASHYRPTTLSENEGSVGDGGDELRKMLAAPEIGYGNTSGLYRAPMKLISGFLQARFEEALGGEAWPQSWGAAYDALAYQMDQFGRGGFRWLPKLTYLGWDVTVDSNDRITKVTPAPAVFTQEHIHSCTLMVSRRLSETGPDPAKLSYPIDRDDLDHDMYLRRPYSAVSPYYANYFRVFLPDSHLMVLCMAAENATHNGIMWHAGTDEADPHFQVNASALEEHVRRLLVDARASYARRESAEKAG